MEHDCTTDSPIIDLSDDDEMAVEETGQAFVKMPELSDRCGGSRGNTVMVPVPEGMVLPDSVVTVRLDPEDD